MKKINVNLGCGTNIVKGWINIDMVAPPNADKDFKVGSAMDIPLEKNSVDYLLMDQVLEHIPTYDIPTVLHEVRRVLKIGGRCVIIVPDFRSAAEDWLNLDHEHGFDPFAYKYVSEVIYGNQLHEGEYHKTAMTPGFLHYALGMVGLTKADLIMYSKLSPVPRYPGIREYSSTALCRNAQLVADIIKTQ